MNAENFAEVIRNPSQLYQISYQELKSLVLQYPYCRNLHYLLLKKSHINQRADFENVLEKTATYSIDRRYLYLEMRALEPQEEMLNESFEIGEDFLELKDLNSLEKEREPIPLHILREESESQEMAEGHNSDDTEPLLPDFTPEEPVDLEEEEWTIPSIDFPAQIENEEPGLTEPPKESSFLPDNILLLNLAAGLEAVEEISVTKHQGNRVVAGSGQANDSVIDAITSMSQVLESDSPASAVKEPKASRPKRPQPKPKSSFKSWVKQFQPAHVQPHLDELMESAKPKKKKIRKKSKIVSFAEQSLREHEEVISETLAELFVQQERYDKAIQMYRRLSLIFPEKSSYFAQIIQEIQKHQ